MSESGDYTPAPHWRGASHDFVSARRSYASVADRSYSEAVSKGVDVADLVPEEIRTDCESPLVIAIDVTGSMGDWPITIFSKLPYLEHEGQEYLGDDMEISFCAIGDSKSDTYPLQVREFVKGAKLKTELEALVHEGNGGANQQESYDLAALYYSRNCEMDEAIRKPIFIFIGDEGVYDPDFSPNAATIAQTKVDGRSNPKSTFGALCQKFSVYCIRKQYGSIAEAKIHKQWQELLGADHVINLQAAERVVDVIFGILARETGRIEYFEDELEDRQGKDKDGDEKIAIVLKSLHSIHKTGKAASVKKIAGPKGGGKSKSIAVKKKTSKKATKKKKPAKSISLLDD